MTLLSDIIYNCKKTFYKILELNLMQLLIILQLTFNNQQLINTFT